MLGFVGFPELLIRVSCWLLSAYTIGTKLPGTMLDGENGETFFWNKKTFLRLVFFSSKVLPFQIYKMASVFHTVVNVVVVGGALCMVDWSTVHHFHMDEVLSFVCMLWVSVLRFVYSTKKKKRKSNVIYW